MVQLRMPLKLEEVVFYSISDIQMERQTAYQLLLERIPQTIEQNHVHYYMQQRCLTILQIRQNETVLLIDCKSVLQSMNAGERNQLLRELIRELETLREKTELVVQWLVIPAHCGINCIEKADILLKEVVKRSNLNMK